MAIEIGTFTRDIDLYITGPLREELNAVFYEETDDVSASGFGELAFERSTLTYILYFCVQT